jgi:WD40 repeat protein
MCDSRPLNRPWNNNKKGGVSAVTSMLQPLQFATGGYDHVVHLWNVKPDLSSASPRALFIKHNSQIQSLLAIRDTSHKLISTGADCNVHIWDLASERVVKTVKTSNSPYHIHATTSPFCTLLEVPCSFVSWVFSNLYLCPRLPTANCNSKFVTTDLFLNSQYSALVIRLKSFMEGL